MHWHTILNSVLVLPTLQTLMINGIPSSVNFTAATPLLLASSLGYLTIVGCSVRQTKALLALLSLLSYPESTLASISFDAIPYRRVGFARSKYEHLDQEIRKIQEKVHTVAWKEPTNSRDERFGSWQEVREHFGGPS